MKTYTITTRYINEYVRVVEAKSKKEALEMGLELDARHGSVFSEVYLHNEKVEITPDAEVSHVESEEEKAAWAGQSAIGTTHSNEIAPLKPIDVTPDTDEGHAKYIAECDAEWASHWKSSSI